MGALNTNKDKADLWWQKAEMGSGCMEPATERRYLYRVRS